MTDEQDENDEEEEENEMNEDEEKTICLVCGQEDHDEAEAKDCDEHWVRLLPMIRGEGFGA